MYFETLTPLSKEVSTFLCFKKTDTEKKIKNQNKAIFFVTTFILKHKTQ